MGRNHSLRLYQTGRYSQGERGETVQAGTEGGTLSPPRLSLSENDLVCDPERYVGSDGVTDYCYLSRKYCCSSDFSDDHEDSAVLGHGVAHPSPLARPLTNLKQDMLHSPPI